MPKSKNKVKLKNDRSAGNTLGVAVVLFLKGGL